MICHCRKWLCHDRAARSKISIGPARENGSQSHQDESVATAPPDGILVGAGAIGEIVRVAMHTEASVPIYLVDFGERLVVGCLEEEITVL